jgi:hypothetical protein
MEHLTDLLGAAAPAFGQALGGEWPRGRGGEYAFASIVGVDMRIGV